MGDTCAVAVRLAVDELHGPGDYLGRRGPAGSSMLAELPDLWDVNVAGALGNDSRSARFSAEGFQEDNVAFIEATDDKARGVGRAVHFARPDGVPDQAGCAGFHWRGAAVDP